VPLPADLRSLFRRRRLPLGFYLAVLVACAVIPVLLFSIGFIVRDYREERAYAETRMLDVARALAAALDREMLVTVGVLELLAQSTALEKGDLAAFHAEARRVVGRRPGWNSVLLFTPDGQQLVNTIHPWGTPLARVNDPASLAEIVRTRKPVVGNLVAGSVTGQLAFPVRVPILRDGELAYVLTAAIRPGALQDVLVHTFPMGSEWARGFNDHNGILVARSRDPERFVGRRGSPELLRRRATMDESFFRDRTIDGAEVYVAYTRAPFSRWTAGLGVPVAVIEAPLRRSLAWSIGTGLGLLALAGAAAYVVGRRIARPIRAATVAAQALTRGEEVGVPASHVREVAELGEALRHSAYLLQVRDAERSVLLEQAQIARGEAETANRAKDDFLATLSHELRSPLGAILGWVRMLRSGRLTAAQTTRALEVIERNVNLQTGVIGDLLDVSRIAAGKLQLERRPTDVRRAVEAALEQIRHQADGKGVTFATAMPREPVTVDGDEVRLVQIVANLVANAVKFTPQDGRVTTIVSAEPETVTITVSDTGSGISSDALPHIFERFHQEGTGSGVRGLGLGLAIVRSLTELHGGRVDVASDGPGRGSRFTVTLPRSGRTADVSSAPSTGRTPVPGLRVLVVEDEPDSLDMLTTLLGKQGLQVTAVSSADAALAAWSRGRFDALVSDIRMPGRDGCELVAEIRGLENGARVRAVAVSANATSQDRERALAAGFDVHLAKPFDPDDLLAALA
jgi:signal transduction histidine kinase